MKEDGTRFRVALKHLFLVTLSCLPDFIPNRLLTPNRNAKTKIHPSNQLIEVTTRTLQGRHLLRPSQSINQSIIGALAMAQQRTSMKVHFVVCMSNHIHLLLSPTDAQQLAKFMEHFKSKLAREVNKLHGWEGPVFHGRYRAIPVSEEPEAQIERLRYLIAHGVKENLVENPLQWPGVQAVKHYVNDEPMRGIWVDRTAMTQKPSEPECHQRTLELRLDPLPGYDPRAFRDLVRELLRQVVAEADKRRRAEKTQVLGIRRALKQHPHWRPPKLEKLPPPQIHAIRGEVRRRYKEALSEFLRTYREATERLKRDLPRLRFPPGCFPPAGPFVPLMSS